MQFIPDPPKAARQWSPNIHQNFIMCCAVQFPNLSLKMGHIEERYSLNYKRYPRIASVESTKEGISTSVNCVPSIDSHDTGKHIYDYLYSYLFFADNIDLDNSV